LGGEVRGHFSVLACRDLRLDVPGGNIDGSRDDDVRVSAMRSVRHSFGSYRGRVGGEGRVAVASLVAGRWETRLAHVWSSI